MKFQFSPSFIIDMAEEPFKSEGLRVGFYSAPGTRKSYTMAACIIEPFLEAGGTVVIFEPRSEWHTLKEKFGSVVVCGGPYQDIPLATKHAKIYAEAIINNGVSMIFDFSETEDRDLVSFAAELLARIYTLENVVRRPILLVPEEASDYCPFSAKGKMVEPWIYERMTSRILKFATQGRPLGVMIALTSQRPAQLNYTVRMMCNISFYGKFHAKDLTDIEEVLDPYRKQGINPKEVANECVNMPHGQWLTITGAQVTKLTVETKRLTSHGADTPGLLSLAAQTPETQQTLTNLAKTIKDLIAQEEAEESQVTKLRKEAATLSEELDKKETRIKQLETSLEVAGNIKITQPEISQERINEMVKQKVSEHLNALRIELSETIDQYQEGTFGIPQQSAAQQSVVPQSTTQSNEVFDTWASKLSPAGRRIFKLLAIDKKGLHLTKREVAVTLGYAYQGGAFRGALTMLIRNNLIKTQGDVVWCE